ncbi:SDR family NAD(P)-dependent oxidoreductase [Agrobacterium pusense]|uniref:SDR family oxidoreductase n=1 Tax=Agrobacterium pusense TaxID=648995 RepID=U4Q4H1_9HYPH|nr:SDR family oxidoreductase [Agrobacterium pusense]CDI12153.1 protein of unknown function [Agrobacterium pusense]
MAITYEQVPSLAGQLVVVNGATGNVGEGIVRSFLRAGARVIALSRNSEKLDVLRSYLKDENLEQLVAVAGDTTTFDGYRALANELAETHGAIDHVVSSVNTGWSQSKAVWDVNEAEFDKYVLPNIKAHYAASRALGPHLRRGGSFSFIAGMSAILPLPGMSLMGILGGGQLMLATDLQADADDRFRVNTLVLGIVVSRSRPQGKPDWITADDVGRVAAHVAASSVKGQQLRLDDKSVAARTVAGLSG